MSLNWYFWGEGVHPSVKYFSIKSLNAYLFFRSWSDDLNLEELKNQLVHQIELYQSDDKTRMTHVLQKEAINHRLGYRIGQGFSDFIANFTLNTGDDLVEILMILGIPGHIIAANLSHFYILGVEQDGGVKKLLVQNDWLVERCYLPQRGLGISHQYQAQILEFCDHFQSLLLGIGIGQIPEKFSSIEDFLVLQSKSSRGGCVAQLLVSDLKNLV
ncbi:MAG: hypothetical protein NZ480_02345 [Bdellovibrionaceae bacterium]|nr:hypothetical protein [Pseudobdellovibrionaceae bacterium]MDW8189547.1 hypothetical protein [Pseudobdellovibrionaceae bacterium]